MNDARAGSAAAPRRHLELATSLARTPGGPGGGPGSRLFSGFLEHPDVVAAGLLALADIAATAYVEPRPTYPSTQSSTRPPARPDPIVTAGGDRLRFEAFSMCNGVYVRLDLLREALGPEDVGWGTTTVDLNPTLCAALARLEGPQPLRLSIGRDPEPGSSPDNVAEVPAALPDLWVRGLGEVPALLRGMGPRGALVGPQIAGFIAHLPPQPPPGPFVHVVPTPGSWTVAPTPVPGSVPLHGTSRLGGLGPVLRLVKRLHLHAHPHGASAWEVEMPGARLTLALAPDAHRGFSGETALLTLLSRAGDPSPDDRLAETLGWTSVVRPAELADDLGVPVDLVDAGLSRLAATGRLGYDLGEHAWFHRDLPLAGEPAGATVLPSHPRQAAARRLVDEGGVVEGADGGAWLVRGNGEVVHAVKLGGEGWRCECAWEEEHHGQRGPCTHILAVLLSRSPAGHADVDRPPAPDTLDG